MNRSALPGTDSLPWYRQFWPWFLILLPASVVLAALVTLTIAQRNPHDLVADDYYRDGLAINRRLEKLERARELGIAASLSFSGQRVTVELSGPVGAQRLDLALAHPLEAGKDFSASLVRAAPQRYTGRLDVPVSARWHWSLQPPAPADWRLDGVVHAADIDREYRD